MYNIVRKIRKITTPKFGALITLGGTVLAALVLSLTIAGCLAPVPIGGGDGTQNDTTAPAPVVLSVAPGDTNDSVVITWTDPTDDDFSHIVLSWTPVDGGETQTLRIDAGVGTATITGLVPDGNYTFTAVAVDTAGNESERGPTTQRIDDTPPAQVTLTVAPGTTNDSVIVTWTDPTDTDFSHVLIYWAVDGGTPGDPLRVERGVETATVTGLGSGDYTFTAVTVDTANNMSAMSAGVQGAADTTAPAQVTLTVARGTTNESVIVTWTDPTDTDFSHVLIYWVAAGSTTPGDPLRVDGGVETATVTGLGSSDYTFTAVSVDAVGNESAMSTGVQGAADTTPPALVTLAVAPGATTDSVVVTWTDPTDTDFSHILLYWVAAGSTTPGTPRRINADVETATITGLGSGNYTFTAVSVDDLDNESEMSAGVQRITDTVDTTAPARVALTVAPGTTNESIIVTWTDPPDTDFSHIVLTWSLSGSSQTPAGSPRQINAGVETATITGLGSGTYTFTAVSVDNADNSSAASDAVQGSIDTTPPAVPVLMGAAAANGGARITWTDPSDDKNNFSHILLSWTPSGVGGTQPRRINAGIQSATVTGLTGGSTYMFTAKSVDGSGNQSAASTAVSVTIDTSGPSAVTGIIAFPTSINSTVALSWNNPPATDTDFSYVTITWSPDGGRADLQPLRVDFDTPRPTTGSASVGYLTPGTYTFTVNSVDAAGNATPATATATVPTDTFAPGVVTLGRSPTVLANGRAVVTWTDPTDFDFSHLLLSWTATGQTPGSLRVNKGVETATITGLADGAVYSITARSVDTTGNRSNPGGAVMVTADAAVPAVTGISATASISGAIVTWTDPTVSDFSHVNITWDPPGGTLTQPVRVSRGTQRAILAGLTGGTAYTVTATSVDTLGNQATATATVTPNAATASPVTSASATRITPVGVTTVTWTDPTSGSSSISITGTPAPTTAVAVALGSQTATIRGLNPRVNHIIIIETLDSNGDATSAVAVAADATLPVALFRLGGSSGVHDGDFGYAACNDELTTGTGSVATAMQNAGYTKAVFFGSKGTLPLYDFDKLATDKDGLGIAGINNPTAAQITLLEARPVVVYATAEPTTTFGSPPVSRTIGDVVNVGNGGEWQTGGYTVVDDLVTGRFWSFTENKRTVGGAQSCNFAREAVSTNNGIYGNSTAIDGSTGSAVSTAACNVELPVICAAQSE